MTRVTPIPTSHGAFCRDRILTLFNLCKVSHSGPDTLLTPLTCYLENIWSPQFDFFFVSLFDNSLKVSDKSPTTKESDDHGAGAGLLSGARHLLFSSQVIIKRNFHNRDCHPSPQSGKWKNKIYFAATTLNWILSLMLFIYFPNNNVKA